MSGSVPFFSVPRLVRRLCLSTNDDLFDIKVIRGGDVIGDFPLGFKIRVTIEAKYLSNAFNFVIKRLGPRTTLMQCAVHVFVSEKVDGNKLLGWLRPRYDCRLVTSENSREEDNHVATQWAESKFDVLISTSIALVGNENPKCRHLVCAGYLFDNMQMVQAFGRLRPYMRTPIGQVFVSVPKEMPDP
jgi:hypothetical protein